MQAEQQYRHRSADAGLCLSVLFKALLLMLLKLICIIAARTADCVLLALFLDIYQNR